MLAAAPPLSSSPLSSHLTLPPAACLLLTQSRAFKFPRFDCLQATDDDLHNHHAAVVGAIASIHKSKANLAAPDVEAAHAHAHAHGQDCLHPHDSTGSGSDTSGKPSDVEAGTAAPGAAGEDGGEQGHRRV